MAEAVDNLVRLALLEAWGAACVWCRRPIYFNEMEVEHLIPRFLDDAKNEEQRVQILELHGLDADYDINSLENLAPSCRPCNAAKGPKPPPDAPVVAQLLARARTQAPAIRAGAGKMRGDRTIERSAAVLVAGAEDGNPKAVDAIREAAQTLNVAVKRATGHEAPRLHSLLDTLVSGEASTADAGHFDYVATIGPTDGPSHGVAKGTIMSYVETQAAVTKRIDVIPRNDAAVETYGPKFTLSPVEGEAGERAAATLSEALEKGRTVEITEGLDVTFDRMPPRFAAEEGKRIVGGAIRIAPAGPGAAQKRAIPDWRAEIRMASASGDATLRVRLRETEPAPSGWDAALVGRRGGIVVTALLRERERSGEMRFDFQYIPDGLSIREHLAGMRFIAALARGGELYISDRGKTERPELRMASVESEILPKAEAFVALLSDLVVIEDWTDSRFSLPEEISAEEIHHIAQTAALIRSGERSIAWSSATLSVLEPAVAKLREGGVMRIEAEASTLVLGREVQLGALRRDVPAYDFVSATPLKGQKGTFQVVIRPATEEAARTKEILLQPRAGRRPPPPPPRKGRSRKRRRRGG